jgi:hypothetical protein
MRVLVTNHHLRDRAGSELATAEIASELAARGHEVRIFTLMTGPFGDEIAAATGLPVLGPTEVADVRAFAPEVIHAHHWPTVVWLRGNGVAAPVVMGFLGVLPPLENPPVLEGSSVSPWWAVSEEAAQNVAATSGWATQPSAIIHNWFDDRTGLPPVTRGSTDLRRILVVSNHFPAGTREVLDRLAAELRIDVDHVGLPHNPQRVDPALIAQHDAVISLGRTVVTAMAWGVPALVLDQHGTDGWVTPSSRVDIGRHNYSGRARGWTITDDVLRTLLSDPPTLEERIELQQWCQTHARLTRVAPELERLYDLALRGGPPADPMFGAWSGVVTEYLDRLRLEEHLRSTADEAARLILVELDRHRVLLTEATERLLETEAREHAVRDRLASIEGSRVWRSTGWYRSLRARLAAGRGAAPTS